MKENTQHASISVESDTRQAVAHIEAVEEVAGYDWLSTAIGICDAGRQGDPYTALFLNEIGQALVVYQRYRDNSDKNDKGSKNDRGR